MVIGLMIGSGIFRVPSSIAAEAGSAPAILTVWVLGGIICLCGALSLAELATIFPHAGGQYVFLRQTYGPLVAFLYGWTFLLVSPNVWAALALIFAGYLNTFVPLGENGTRIAAAALIVVVSAANYRSVSFGASIQSVSTIAKVLALVGLASTIFIVGRHGAEPVAAAAPAALDWGSLGLALISVIFAYGGWSEFTGLAGEVRDPGRNLPVALAAGTGTVIIVYVIVNAAYLTALPAQAVASSTFVAADAMTRTVGPAGASIVSALVMLSTFGALCGAALAFPRVFYAMGQDEVLFRSLAAVHPRFLTPHRAIAFTAAVALIYVSARTFEQLAEAMVIGTEPFNVLLVLAVLLLRRTRPRLPRPYRIPGYPVAPVVFLLAMIGVLLNALLEHPGSTLLSVGITLLGVPIFAVLRGFVSKN